MLALQQPTTVVTVNFRTLYDRELAYVWSTLRRLGVAPADREDLCHEVFLVVHRRLGDYDDSRPLRPWLFGIAYRVASEHRRRRAVERAETSLVDTDIVSEAEQEVDVARTQDRALIAAALGTVPVERRAVFILHDIDGSAAPDIAAALGIPLNTVYSRLRLARQDFAKAVMQRRPR